MFCGGINGDEGYGTQVWCPKCNINTNSSESEYTRVTIMGNQNRLHDRMFKSSAKRFHPACVGDKVIIPIVRPDMMNSLGQGNMIGVVTEVENDNYTIGTRDGILNNEYSRNQFELCSTNFIQPDNVPSSSISQTAAMEMHRLIS